MFDFFPEWFQIFFGSMVPFLESRYILPYAMWEFNWQWWEAFPLAIIGNILPIPFVLIFFKYVEKYRNRISDKQNHGVIPYLALKRNLRRIILIRPVCIEGFLFGNGKIITEWRS